MQDELLDAIFKEYDLSHDGCIERSEILAAVKKYRKLLAKDAKLRALFERHDTDKSGYLPPDQLHSLLTEVAKTMAYSEDCQKNSE